jgi:hypothetical protein
MGSAGFPPAGSGILPELDVGILPTEAQRAFVRCGIPRARCPSDVSGWKPDTAGWKPALPNASHSPWFPPFPLTIAPLASCL